MKRTRFLAAASAAAASVRTLPARAAEFTYKFGHPDPVGLPQHVRMVQMAAAVEAQSHGRMKITVYPNSTLGSQTSMLGQLRDGSLEFLMTLDATYSGIVPVAGINSVGFAFGTSLDAARALDGALGAYVRREFAAKGLFAFAKTPEVGLRQVTSSTKPIRVSDDFAGFKIRTPPARIFLDLFRSLGASPVPLDSNEVYTGLQTHLIDGQETPYQAIDGKRLFEVQRYLSVTNHCWGGYWIAANAEKWNALPADLREIVRRNIESAVLLERRDMYALNAALPDKLHREGMLFNTADSAGMKARLVPYYARWKAEFGPTAWALLEETTGKLG